MRNGQLSRRNFLRCLTVPLGHLLSAAKASEQRPLVGAIRWDAWYAPNSSVTEAVRESLAPAEYNWRLPFFARKQNDASIIFPEATQAEIDLEIAQARFSGIDFWAFVAYDKIDPMSLALHYYLASSKPGSSLRFCMFTELGRWGTADRISPLVDEHIELMRQSKYVKVLGNRPLYFLGFISKQIVNDRWGGPLRLRTAIKEFRRKSVHAGVGNPFIVLAGPLNELSTWSVLGGDAVGEYAISKEVTAGKYAELTRVAEMGWNTLLRARLPVVPTVMAGWDRRPRIAHPVPWEKTQKPGVGIDRYFDTPRPNQLASHLSRALHWIKSQPAKSQAPAALIYAWNENDEGGWLVPTKPCDTSRIQVLHENLNSGDKNQNPGCVVSR